MKEKKNQFQLVLSRPVVFLDVETTGLNVEQDRIVEISMTKLLPDGSVETKTKRVNPGVPIPQAAIDVHGITDDMVKDQPRFEQLAKGIHEFIDGCDCVGFNSIRFDIPFLFFSLSRAGVNWNWRKVNLIDVGNIFKIKEERTLTAAVRHYLGRDHVDGHSSEADVAATHDVFIAQLAKYEDLPRDFKELAKFSNFGQDIVDMAGKFVRDQDGDICFNFGKHKGKKAKTEKNYLLWMTRDGDFTADTKQVANSISFL